MSRELIQVVADGVPYEGWESIIVDWSMDNPYVIAQLTTTEIPNTPGDLSSFDKWNFPPGTAVEIYVTGNKFMAGYVDVYAPAYNADFHNITLTIATNSKNFADSSVNHPTGNFENTTDSAVIQEFARLAGIELQDLSQPEQLPFWQTRQGATYFQETLRMVQSHQKYVMGMLQGPMSLNGPKPFFVNENGLIIQGVNILQAEGRLSAEMFATIMATGQAPVGVDKLQNIETYGIATMGSLPPLMQSRFKHIIDQRATTNELAQKRAQWEMWRQHGARTQAFVTVDSWRDKAGAFWSANSDAYVWSPFLQIDCMMRIQRVVFRQDTGSGTVANLTLIDPAAYGQLHQSMVCNSSDFWQLFK
jgi:prophage tail gpP-like protein